MIWNGDIDLEHLDIRSEHALGSTKRLVKHQPKRETRFDCKRRIYRLSAALSGGRGMPCLHRFLGKPYREASCRTSAASYSGQFVTRYLAFGILWRRLVLNLYGIDLPIRQTGHRLPYDRSAATAPSTRATVVY